MQRRVFSFVKQLWSPISALDLVWGKYFVYVQATLFHLCLSRAALGQAGFIHSLLQLRMSVYQDCASCIASSHANRRNVLQGVTVHQHNVSINPLPLWVCHRPRRRHPKKVQHIIQVLHCTIRIPRPWRVILHVCQRQSPPSLQAATRAAVVSRWSASSPPQPERRSSSSRPPPCRPPPRRAGESRARRVAEGLDLSLPTLYTSGDWPGKKVWAWKLRSKIALSQWAFLRPKTRGEKKCMGKHMGKLWSKSGRRYADFKLIAVAILAQVMGLTLYSHLSLSPLLPTWGYG